MNLDRVTITGADDSVRPQNLVPLSKEFPFVEWGILFSGSRLGIPRYPSKAWIEQLAKVAWQVPMQLSAHLCGVWVRELVLHGRFNWMGEYKPHSLLFNRVQLNFHGQFHKKCSGFEEVLSREGRHPSTLQGVLGREFIFQCDGPNDRTVEELQPQHPMAVFPLFDRSGGAGVVPAEWPRAWPGVYCGYAGGLGPDNLYTQLQFIDRAAGTENVWIDMETRIRSENDAVFDLGKVRRCLEIAAPFVSTVPHGSVER
jgi:hypothetical protein